MQKLNPLDRKTVERIAKEKNELIDFYQRTANEIGQSLDLWMRIWLENHCKGCHHEKMSLSHADCEKCEVGELYHKITGKPWDWEERE